MQLTLYSNVIAGVILSVAYSNAYILTLVTLCLCVYSFACRHCLQNFEKLFRKKNSFRASRLTPPRVWKLEISFLCSNQHAGVYRQYENFKFRAQIFLHEFWIKFLKFGIFEYYEKTQTKLYRFALECVE